MGITFGRCLQVRFIGLGVVLWDSGLQEPAGALGGVNSLLQGSANDPWDQTQPTVDAAGTKNGFLHF